ncbi:2485_t:CDS:2 [Paraglomus occultum]|uniref:2485_t:CDS:1 n=1 Tax=Paraglomus occultum TaxID=144539 RepID=A0A9N9BR51_9GLOM|nr:2485_t:CDS:2 [Paraglomus occultum]
MGLLLAVNAGSHHEPRVVILRYFGDKKNKKNVLGLVGKGITFDSGGYDLKPSQYLQCMKFDMSGAAVVCASFLGLVQKKPAINVIAVACLTENAIGGHATLTESVITSMNGKTVEINNTDAEGRLVLADGITYAIQKEKATKIITVATLTGACVLALGENTTGLNPVMISKKSKLEDNIAIVIQEEDNGNNNNDKKVKDCPTCLEKINYALAKCEDWETKRKKQLEDLKKEKCFHEKNIDNTPLLLRTSGYSKTKDKCTKCQREYVSSKSNKEGDKKTFSHNCSQEPDNQRDEEDDNDNSNNNKIAEKSTVRKYCKDNDIKRLEYDEGTGKLIIIYNKSDKPKSELDNLNEELQEIKNYLKKNGQKDNKNKKYFLTDRD